MKKLLNTAILVAFVLLFASCKKDYTCTCTYIDNVTNVSTTKLIPMHGTRNTVRVDCANEELELTYYGRSVDCSF